jgi:hypothetical protein
MSKELVHAKEPTERDDGGRQAHTRAYDSGQSDLIVTACGIRVLGRIRQV